MEKRNFTGAATWTSRPLFWAHVVFIAFAAAMWTALHFSEQIVWAMDYTKPFWNVMYNAFGLHDGVLAINRLLLGGFFVLARFRWFYDPSRPHPWFNHERHEHLTWKMCVCGFAKSWFLAGSVACIEVFAGLALIVGFMTPLAGFGLLCVLGAATYCTAREKVMEQKPVDRIDVVSDYLWRVEGLYIGMALMAILGGAGSFSLDAWLAFR